MKNTIHYVLILDQSGSMFQLKREVILSFNEQVDMILKLKKKEPDSKIKLTLCIFNDVVDFKFIAHDVDQIKKLTDADYRRKLHAGADCPDVSGSSRKAA